MKALALITLVIITGCAGIKVRESVQMPVMLAAYNTVVLPHIERGIALVATDAGQERARTSALALRAALQSGSRAHVAVLMEDWQKGLRPLFLAGLDLRVLSGEIGPAGAIVLRETMRQFDTNMTLLVSR